MVLTRRMWRILRAHRRVRTCLPRALRARLQPPHRNMGTHPPPTPHPRPNRGNHLRALHHQHPRKMERNNRRRPRTIPQSRRRRTRTPERRTDTRAPTTPHIAETIYCHFINNNLEKWNETSEGVRERYLNAADAVLALLKGEPK